MTDQLKGAEELTLPLTYSDAYLEDVILDLDDETYARYVAHLQANGYKRVDALLAAGVAL